MLSLNNIPAFATLVATPKALRELCNAFFGRPLREGEYADWSICGMIESLGFKAPNGKLFECAKLEHGEFRVNASILQYFCEFLGVPFPEDLVHEEYKKAFALRGDALPWMIPYVAHVLKSTKALRKELEEQKTVHQSNLRLRAVMAFLESTIKFYEP
jgi:hypothetical protein